MSARWPRKAAAPSALVMTLIGLITGAVWGQPMWGTWWAWDPRLTSFLILFLFYLGYIALWAAIEDPDTAADLTAVLCLVGSVFALLSRYAAFFWNQGLHQGASLSPRPARGWTGPTRRRSMSAWWVSA
jgi:heme exporter protein C